MNTNEKKIKVLVTGAAGFIGFHLINALLKQSYEVIGMDCINAYYDTTLKYNRLKECGIQQEFITENKLIKSIVNPSYRFIKLDLTDRMNLACLFKQEQFDIVINLAGQAGVRYSIENPYAYIESNVTGFLNILENCRHHPIKHLLFASSSSVYGMNNHVPYNETDTTDQPVSLYAATKKADELMAYSYSTLYHIPTTGLRFFTVYGPWGRPDMAPYLFLKAIVNKQPIKIFNNGNLSRDFTYIDEIIDGIMCVLEHPSTNKIPYNIYNIGHSSPVKLMDFISIIEKTSNRKADKIMLEMQPGDVYCTYADTTRIEHDFQYKPQTSITEGIRKFYDWYMSYIHTQSL